MFKEMFLRIKMSETEILLEFKTQLIAFFDELITQFPEQGNLLVARIFLSSQVPIKDVMDTINLQLNLNDQQLKKMIRERNDNFFLEHDIFNGLGKDEVTIFKNIWRSDRLDADDKKVIWTWIDTFVYFTEKYTKVLANK